VKVTPRSIGERVAALETVVAGGEGLLPDTAIARGAGIIANSAGRLRHGTDHTVVAIAGATGSGKSSLFNAMAGVQIAPVGVLRPTTSQARAAVFGTGVPGELLAWLGVRHQHGIEPAGDLEGLVLIDLPDHDSVVSEHRLVVDRLVDLVDAMVWVLDPQKYADAALHDGYLRALSHHGEVMIFVLNQVDLVAAADRERWTAHAVSTLRSDGFANPAVLVVSAVTGEGVAPLRREIRSRIAARDVALRRLDADLRTVASACGDIPEPPPAGALAERKLAEGLATAAGAGTVGAAVAAGYRHDAARKTGWPFARLVLRLKRHPLRALRPMQTFGTGAAPATAVPIDRDRLSLAVKLYADARTGAIPTAWSRRARSAAATDLETMAPALSSAVTAAARSAIAPPRWWGVVGRLQWTLAAVAAAGAAWLAALAVLGYLKVPTDGFIPRLGEWPIPTLLLLGGAAAGLLVALVARPIATAGGRRRAHRAVRDIERKLAGIASDRVAGPLDAELERWAQLRRSLATVGGG